MKRHIQTHRQQEQAESKTETAKPREFTTPDEMLRHDCLHTPVPPSLSSRLHDSISQVAPSKKEPWWRKLFGS